MEAEVLEVDSILQRSVAAHPDGVWMPFHVAHPVRPLPLTALNVMFPAPVLCPIAT
ncbi:MAG: hypothetical protein ACTSWQ_05845 [Candidatus Thorarchaeota archaeon]